MNLRPLPQNKPNLRVSDKTKIKLKKKMLSFLLIFDPMLWMGWMGWVVGRGEEEEEEEEGEERRRRSPLLLLLLLLLPPHTPHSPPQQPPFIIIIFFLTFFSLHNDSSVSILVKMHNVSHFENCRPSPPFFLLLKSLPLFSFLCFR